jgi:hypothetical protein
VVCLTSKSVYVFIYITDIVSQESEDKVLFFPHYY